MPFAKGHSPNPDGRKIEAQVRRRARSEAEKSIAVLATVRDNATAPPEIRAQAAMQLLALGNWKFHTGAGLSLVAAA
jgi:hypothetical protein